MDEEFDTQRLQASEEMTFQSAHVLETLIQLLIDKGFFTEQELIDKMEELGEQDDVEELSFDADAPRDADTSEE